MINIEFYTFAKKKNSTAIPSSTGATTLSCALKEQCGVVNPVVQVTLPAGANPTFNYMHIASWARYYFIDEWTYIGGMWEASAHVDVLASFKTAIGSSTQYILRCSDSDYYDGDIIDRLYPTMDGAIIEEETSGAMFAGNSYIVGIYGGDGNSISVGPITVYHFTPTQMQNFSEWLYSKDFYDETGMLVEKAVFNPAQYIAFAFWLPINAPISGTGLPVKIGWFETPVEQTENPPFIASRLSAPTTGPINVTVTVPKHPQASARGKYLNLDPTATYTLYAGPFGIIPLSSADLYDVNSLTLRLKEVDFTTGFARLQVLAGSKVIAERQEQISVPIPLAQMSQSLLGNTAQQFLSKAGFFGQMIQSVGLAIADSGFLGVSSDSLLPQISTSGGIGTRIGIYNPYLVAKFLKIVDENLDHAGRPCCQELTIGNLSGYIKCADGELEVSATGPELEELSGFLTGGFFYE